LFFLDLRPNVGSIAVLFYGRDCGLKAREKTMSTGVAERLRRKTVVGVVTSNKMEKTITVRIERYVQHPRYGKFLRRHTVCKAHDEKREAGIGDTVRLMETRPLSKTKRWRLVEIVARSARAAGAAAAPGPAPAVAKP
jgi:small subunit ribosomal protein S17